MTMKQDDIIIFSDMRCMNTITGTVESKTRTHNGRVGSARRTADGGAGRSWAEQGADISVGPEANRPSSPPGYRKQLF